MIEKEAFLFDIEDVLGPKGLLSHRLDFFQPREAQLDMSKLIGESFCDTVPAVVEGGTGIGKTLAYLVPALLAGIKVVVSTGTKTLQDQIFFKDLPPLLDALGLETKTAYLKGRNNYLCKWRFERHAAQRDFGFTEETRHMERIAEWSQITATGDRAELEGLPDDFRPWPSISSTADNCLGRKCPLMDSCFVYKARREAREADVVVINHHLYFADLALSDNAFGELLPPYKAAILDEAHMLESIATSHFGVQVSNWTITRLVDDVKRDLSPESFRQAGLLALSERVLGDSTNFFNDLRIGKGRLRLQPDVFDEATQGLYLDFDESLLNFEETLSGIPKKQESAAKHLSDRCHGIRDALTSLVTFAVPASVYWLDIRRRTVVLHASPLDVAPILREVMFDRGRSLVFCSATLSEGGSCEYFKSRLGFPEEVREGLFQSPFDYRTRSVLYVPSHFPSSPNETQFREAMIDEIAFLASLAKGRTLALFTSYANLRHASEHLSDRIPYPILCQGDAPRAQLLEEFRDEPETVLLATSSFWQGVDVEGDSLRCVVVDRLPFEAPGEPVTEARIEYLKQQGASPFFSYQLPMASIRLKQGLGRLIRSVEDWGIMAVLDRRIVLKNYGKRFRSSLPEIPLIHKPEQVESFWRLRKRFEDLREE